MNKYTRKIVHSTEGRRAKFFNLLRLMNTSNIRKRQKSAKKHADRQSMLSRKLDDGISVFEPDTFAGQLEATNFTANYFDSLSSEEILNRRQNKKSQLLTGLFPSKELRIGNPVVDFALSPEILRAVTNYLGSVPIITNIDFWYSVSTPDISNSQLYHCDYASDKQVKLFLYASDVTVDDGPLVAIDAASSKRVRDIYKYKWGKRLSDEQVEKVVPKGEHRVMHGAAGTLVFADTSSCFHYGSRVAQDGQDRKLCMIQYSPAHSFVVREKGRIKYFDVIQGKEKLSDLQKAALGHDEAL